MRTNPGDAGVGHSQVANSDLQAVDKDGNTKRRKGTSTKSSDILIEPPRKAFFCLPPQR
jgi:hypothetical protein